MAPYLFWELIILIVGVWMMAAVFVVYGWLLLRRQKQMMKELLAQPPEKEKQEEPEVTPAPALHLEISKDEPIGKYKDIAPEDVEDVSFVDQEK